ncbi:MAG: ABC transporter ATP-binding protein [Gammaproteobacteria bacterium]|nr:ABC transporter ATP-binding protein [Gammaproteobacteria bacterium]
MLETANLEVRYGPIQAVKGVSLRVEEGEIVALLGANGAGKSSTLWAIAGALAAASGTIWLNGEDVTALSPERMVRKGLSMVPETRDVFPDLTVMENLRLGAFTQRHNREQTAANLERMLTLFPILRQRSDQAAGTLSGGEQQMLVIARAMMSQPRILLLDEPSLGLAPRIVDQIFEMIGELRAAGLTILLVEQNAGKALEIADRVYVVRLGEVAASGTADEVATTYDLKALYLGG